MRVFIGIEFDDEVKNYLNEIQNDVKQSAYKGNFTLYDNFHLTLRFIGEVRDQEVNEISDVLDDIVTKQDSFEIKIGGLGSFNRNNKHIVYVEVLENQEPLKKLSKAIESGLRDLNLNLDEYRFKPHITIAREVEFSQVSILNVLKNYDKPIRVNNISLMLSSRDKQNILKYTPLYRVSLN